MQIFLLKLFLKQDLRFYERDLEFTAPKSRRSVENNALVFAKIKAGCLS